MSDSGFRYWLSWPHTKQDHVVAFALLLAITLAAGYFEELLVAVLSAVMTILVGIRLMAWNAEKAAAGETEDAPLSELLGMGGSWDRGSGPSGDDVAGRNGGNALQGDAPDRTDGDASGRSSEPGADDVERESERA